MENQYQPLLLKQVPEVGRVEEKKRMVKLPG